MRFLTEGNKAKATVVFRGREMTHQELGRKLMEKLIEDLSEVAEVERAPKMEGYALVTIFLPRKR
jgi:translation initiation factor IF-3